MTEVPMTYPTRAATEAAGRSRFHDIAAILVAAKADATLYPEGLAGAARRTGDREYRRPWRKRRHSSLRPFVESPHSSRAWNLITWPN